MYPLVTANKSFKVVPQNNVRNHIEAQATHKTKRLKVLHPETAPATDKPMHKPEIIVAMVV